MKKFLAIILAVVLVSCLFGCGKDDDTNTNSSNEEQNNDAQALVYNDLEYAVNASGDYEITGYLNTNPAKADVVIPAEIDGRPVTGIGAEAFNSCQNVQSVSIPASVTYIGNYAFFDCDSITSIVLPDSVVSIGMGAFEKCDALASVTFSKGLISIGDFAFKECVKLANFTLPEGLLVIGDSAFWACRSLTSVTIPTTVIKLGDGAFYGCTLLASVTLMGDVSEADKQILVKLNTALAAHESDDLTSINKVADALEIDGLYLAGLSDTGCKYIWDAEANQILGAIGAADADLIAKANAALAAAVTETTPAPNNLTAALAVLSNANIQLDTLNISISGDKYEWNSETGLFESVTIGKIVFNACADNLVVQVANNSIFAAYATAQGYTLATAN